MTENKIKGKAAAITGLVIAILSFLLSSLTLFIIIKNDFAMVWGLLALLSLAAGGLSVISLIFSLIGRSKLKTSGGNSKTAWSGMIISIICLIISGSVITKGSMMKPIENAEFNGKDFDKQKNSMDSLLNALNSSGDSTAHKDSLKK